MDPQETKEKYLKYQIIQKKYEELYKQNEELEAQKEEFTITIKAINEVLDIKKTSKILTPLSPGIFIPATLDKEDTFLINVGQGVVVKKNGNEAKKIITNHINSINEMIQKNKNEMMEFDKQFLELQKELEGENV